MAIIMDAKGPVTLCDDRALPIVLSCDSVLDVRAGEAPSPLTVDEVIGCLQQRWQASYDLQLVVRRGRLYLHVMWAYLEQQSFPLDENAYREHIAEVIDVVNRLAQAQVVREWLATTRDRPRLGKALSLPLQGGERLEEFVL
jgi:hypothetical protein